MLTGPSGEALERRRASGRAARPEAPRSISDTNHSCCGWPNCEWLSDLNWPQYQYLIDKVLREPKHQTNLPQCCDSATRAGRAQFDHWTPGLEFGAPHGPTPKNNRPPADGLIGPGFRDSGGLA
jgi:hypothetical protein